MIQSLVMAVKSVTGNKFRAFLTMLGIIIGVMALVILVSLVTGATGSVTDTISGLGTDLMTVTIEDDKGRPVTLKILSEWEQMEGIGLIAPSEQSSATAKYGTTYKTIRLYGTLPAYEQINGLEVLLGRFLKTPDIDNHSTVCVINEAAATELVGYTDCLGEEISLDGMKYKIVGILKDNDNNLTAAFKSNTIVAYIPYTSLMRLSSEASSQISDFSVSAEEGSTMDAAEAVMKSLLMERFNYDEDAFDVSGQDALSSTKSSITSVLTVLLGGIAGISLVVGGIGIMNIMLVTVTERTKEIGIRKAIGAGRGVILQQFLMESVMLCMLGCAVGVFMSWAVLRVISTVVSSLNMTFSLEWNVVLIAVGFCFLIGIVFGLYPANKAAKLPPIEALHYGG